MNRKTFLILIGVIGLAVVGYAALNLAPRDTGMGSKLKVTASFYPMAEFARQVGGDRVEVKTLIAPGVEPHDYDPPPKDIVAVQASKVFVYNGAGLETWAGKLKAGLAKRGTVAVDASAGLPLKAKDPSEVQPGDTSAYDPHVWLDPVLAAQEVDRIAAGFIQADPAGQAVYQANAARFKRDLAGLDATYRTGLSQCVRRDIVTSHQAFKYLGARYGLNALAIAGLSPDEEPSPRKLAEVAQFARAHDVHYIFFETLASPKLSETIAQEVGAKTLVFNPLEGLTPDEQKQGKNYLTVQRENLENLRVALDCK